MTYGLTREENEREIDRLRAECAKLREALQNLVSADTFDERGAALIQACGVFSPGAKPGNLSALKGAE